MISNNDADNTGTSSGIDGRTQVFLLRPEKLLVGDIILSTVSNAAISKTVRQVTQSRFSHASMVIRKGGLIIEAAGKSVRLSSLLNLAARNLENVRVLRLIDKSEGLADRLENAISHCFKDYSFAGAIMSMTQMRFRAPDTEFFCSQLVATAYKEAGVFLFDKESEKIIPEDFVNCAKLSDVTDEIFVRTTIKEARETCFGLRLIEDGSNLIPENDLNQKLKSVAQTFKKKLPRASKWPVSSPVDIIALLSNDEAFRKCGNRKEIHDALLASMNDCRLSSFSKTLSQEFAASFHMDSILAAELGRKVPSREEISKMKKHQNNTIVAHQESLEKRAKMIFELKNFIEKDLNDELRVAPHIYLKMFEEIQLDETQQLEVSKKTLTLLESKT